MNSQAAPYIGDRRVAPRYSVSFRAHYVSPSVATAAEVADISASGALVLTDDLDEVGARCEIVILAEDRHIHLPGRVARLAHEPRGAGMGIVFDAPPEEASRWIDHTIALLSMRV